MSDGVVAPPLDVHGVEVLRTAGGQAVVRVHGRIEGDTGPNAGGTPQLVLTAGFERLWAMPGHLAAGGRFEARFAVPPELQEFALAPARLRWLGTDIDLPRPALPELAALGRFASEDDPGIPLDDEPEASGASILVVDDDELIREVVAESLRAMGHDVTEATDGRDALEKVDASPPDLVVSDVLMPDLDGFGLVEELRAHPATRAVPLIFLTSLGSKDDVVQGLGLGADDYLVKPFDPDELVARVQTKLIRRPVPVDQLRADPRTGLLTLATFDAELDREVARAERGGRSGVVACIALDELAALREAFGRGGEAEILRAVLGALATDAGPLEVGARDESGRLLLLLPETSPAEASARLITLAEDLSGRPLVVAGERVRVTPVAGFAPFFAGATPQRLRDRALVALEHAASHLDLRPQGYDPAMGEEPRSPRPPGRVRRALERLRVPLQIGATQLVGLVVPFLVYVLLDRAGHDISGGMYLVVVGALLMTSLLIWIEGLCSLRSTDPPATDEPEPPASAIIAAYLPNEAATVVETVEAFLRLEYDGDLQVILAYNTPRSLPVEAELAAIAARDPRFVPFKVEGSTSKAQNVNAALPRVTGEFVGVFDADHHPMPGAYRRAWRWLANGYDVVQGHCLVRNGDASWVARTVAVEFEMIYAVSHPGRARLHKFGIFGGSNGYWRTDTLARTRMRGSMLTEDIDSSLRVVEAGGRIASDRGLVSRELAPTTLDALWNQRMRWAQGWFQVSLRHLWYGLRSRRLSVRNKIGLVYLLGWREVYPWISLQMFPLIAFFIYDAGSAGALDWFVPVFVLTTLFTLSVGPWQTLFAYRNADPEIRGRRRWFAWYLFVSSIFYTELKNVIGRVAQVKEAMRERAWKVTPRAGGGDA